MDIGALRYERCMLDAAALALRDILSPPFRAVLVKSLALTLALLILLWAAVEWLVAHYVTTPWGWLDAALDILSGVGLVVALGFLVAPVAALFAGLFLDDVAAVVEATHYPADPPGRPQPFLLSLVTAVKFLGIVLLVNAVALPLVLIVGFGYLIFLGANAYLLGREYFELAALRHHEEGAMLRLRRLNAGTIFGAGLLIALFLMIPIVNILGPLFATAFMVHLEKRLAPASPG
jgi:CysZ protein